jgi:hypothetical protein
LQRRRPVLAEAAAKRGKPQMRFGLSRGNCLWI